MKIITKGSRAFDRIIEITATLAAISLIFIMLIIGVEVTMRYLLDRPIAWATEISEILLLYITFLGAAWVLRIEGHVNINLMLTLLKPRAQALFNVITSAMGVVTCLAIAWFGTQVTWDNYQRGIIEVLVLPIPRVVMLAIIPIGSFLLFIQFLRRTHNYLRSWRALVKRAKES